MALTDNIVAYYKLDGDSSDAVSTYDGTDTDITYNASYGKINQGALFDGDSSKIVLANSETILGTNPSKYSLSAWFKSNDKTAKHYILSDYYSSSGSDTYFGIDIATAITTGYLRVGVRGNSNDYEFTGSTDLCDNNWHFVVVTVNKDTLKMNTYIDGSAVDTDRAIGNYDYINAVPINIGVQYAAGSYINWWKGSLDEIGIWSRALSSTEVTALYNSGNGKQYPFTNTYTKQISEIFALSEIKTKSLTRKISETFAISETLSGLKTKFLALLENIGITEIRRNSITRSLSEIFSIADTKTKSITRRLVEIFNFSDTTDRAISKNRTETITITERIVRILNGNSTIWSNEAKPTSSWTKDTKPSTSWTDDTKPTSSWTNDSK